LYVAVQLDGALLESPTKLKEIVEAPSGGAVRKVASPLTTLSPQRTL
jgi:hypothetical protein